MGLSEDQKAMLRLLAQREEGYEDIAALRGLGVADVRAKVKEALTGLDRPSELPGDQKAMLRLLAQREEGYEDIAALLGLGAGEVRAKVREALTEIDGSAQATPTPAPAPPPSPPEPEPEPAAQEPPPSAEQASSPPAAPRRPGSKSAAAASSRRGISLPKERRRLVELGGAALVVLLLVLFATGAVDLGSGGSDSEDSGTQTETASQTNSKVTQAVLAPPDGGDAIGQAVFGKVGKDPVLLVQAKGLEPSAPGESYTIWLYRSPKLALRVGSVKLRDGEEGIGAQFPVPLQLLSYVSGGAFNQLYISATDDGSYKTEIALAKKQKRLPAYSGTTVLSGAITGPLVER